MYARLVTIPLQADKAEEFEQAMQQQAKVAAESAKGFRGGDVLIDRLNHLGGSVTFWDTREDAEAFTANAGRQDIMRALSSAVAGQPRIEIYEVTLHVPTN